MLQMGSKEEEEKEEKEEEEEKEDARLLRKALLQQGWWHQRERLAEVGFQKLAQDLAAVFFSPRLVLAQKKHLW